MTRIMRFLYLGAVATLAGCYQIPSGEPLGESGYHAPDNTSDGDGGHFGESNNDTDGDPNDRDGDGHTSLASGGGDCNDSRGDIHPGALDDTCNGVNENCDEGNRDGEDSSLRDSNDCGVDDDDGDGVGEEDADGDVLDCDDNDPYTHPGASEKEEDEDDRMACTQDRDLDGYGDDNITASQEDDGVREGSDCNDADMLIHPGVPDTVVNGIDDDCDGRVDSQGGTVGGDGDFDDEDCDSWDEEYDCDDDDEFAFPFAGVNEDFSDDDFEDFPWLCCRDRDQDGYCDWSVTNSEEDDGMIEGSDCNDDDPTVFPDEDGDCVDHDDDGGGSNNDGLLEVRIQSDTPGNEGSTDSWETWVANLSLGIWEWYGFNPRYCGTGTTDIVTCTIGGNSGNYVVINGAYDEGDAWLVTSSGSVIDAVWIDQRSYTLRPSVVDETPSAGECTRRAASYDLICLVF